MQIKAANLTVDVHKPKVFSFWNGFTTKIKPIKVVSRISVKENKSESVFEGCLNCTMLFSKGDMFVHCTWRFSDILSAESIFNCILHSESPIDKHHELYAL